MFTAETMPSSKFYFHLQLSLAVLFCSAGRVSGDERVKEMSMSAGSTVILSCLISGQIPQHLPVSWYWTSLYPECSGSDGGKVVDIFADGRTMIANEFKGRVIVYRSKVRKGDYSITLKGVTIPDSGEFICSHQYFPEEKQVRLMVKPGCMSNLHLTVSPPLVVLGGAVTLTCTYCGEKRLTPQIKWQYDGLPVTDTGVVSLTNNGQSLIISHVNQEHLKKYGCSLAKKESTVIETCLDIDFNLLDTTMFNLDYDLPASTSTPLTSFDVTTAMTTDQTTPQQPDLNPTSQGDDPAWTQNSSPVYSLKTESSSPFTAELKLTTEEMSKSQDETINHSELGSASKDCPVDVDNSGLGDLPTYTCIALGGILLLIIIGCILKRLRGICTCGTHDVEQIASGPVPDDSHASEGMALETQDECLGEARNNNFAEVHDPANGENQDPNQEEEDNSISQVTGVDEGITSEDKETPEIASLYDEEQ